MTPISDKHTEDVKVKAIDDDNFSSSDNIEQQINVKDPVVGEPEAATSKHTLTHQTNMIDHTEGKSFISSTTTPTNKYIQGPSTNITMDSTLDNKHSLPKETMVSISQTDLTALHDKISAQKESLDNFSLSLTTSRAKISSQESTIATLRLPLPCNPNEEIAKLKTENANLHAEISRLKDETKLLDDQKKHMLQKAKSLFQNLRVSDVELWRRHNLIVSANTTLMAKDSRILGLQKQLDSVYATLQRQSLQIGSVQRQHARKLARITEFWKEGVKEARKRVGVQNKRDQNDLSGIMNGDYASEEEDEESSEDEGNDAEATEQHEVAEETDDEKPIKKEIEIVDLIEDDEDANHDEVVVGLGGEKSGVHEQAATAVQWSADQSDKMSATADVFDVTSKSAIDGPLVRERSIIDNPAIDNFTIQNQPLVREQSLPRENSIVQDKPTLDNPLFHENPVVGGSSPPKKRVRLSMEGV